MTLIWLGALVLCVIVAWWFTGPTLDQIDRAIGETFPPDDSEAA